MMLSDVCLSVAYIGPKSRAERPRKTKIDTEVAHVTCDSDTTFKFKRSKVKVTEGGAYCGGLPPTAFFGRVVWLQQRVRHYAYKTTELLHVIIIIIIIGHVNDLIISLCNYYANIRMIIMASISFWAE